MSDSSALANPSHRAQVVKRSPHLRWTESARLARIEDLIRGGMEPNDATWQVLSSPDLGFTDWIALAEQGKRKPPQRIAAARIRLLRRVAPDVAETARHEAVLAASRAAPDVVQRMARAALGKTREDEAVLDGPQVQAARLVMQAAGVIQTGSKTTNTQVNATQIVNHAETIDEAQRILAAHGASVVDAQADGELPDEEAIAEGFESWLEAQRVERVEE